MEDVSLLTQGIELIEKFSAGFEPELLSLPEAREKLQESARGRRLLDFVVTTLAARLDDAERLARVTGTSMGKAKETVATGKVLGESPDLNLAMQNGEVSLDQAAQIAKAEEAAPGAAEELLEVAKKENFNVLRERARKKKLEAEQHRDLGERQREARAARGRIDDLGMAEIYLRLQPHVGVPLINRAETEARRLYKAAKKRGELEPFERYLADAYATMLAGGGKGSTTRADMVMLVSYGVAERGWKDVHEGEYCKIPGHGPISPQEAREIAKSTFLSAVLFDGKDLRQFKTFGKHIPREIAIALELGDPPDFDGLKCGDCGSRFRVERDHIDPRANLGPTQLKNLTGRCDPCHEEKTAEDRKAGKLKPKPRLPAEGRQAGKRKPPDP